MHLPATQWLTLIIDTDIVVQLMLTVSIIFLLPVDSNFLEIFRTSFSSLLISAPRLGVYYFLLLILSVCLFVTLLLQIDSSFLFFDGIEPFLAVISPCGTLQNVVL